MTDDHDMLDVKITQLIVSSVGFVVLLKNDDDPRSLPIFIGAAEAQSIAMVLNDVQVPRPLTHDLMKHVLDLLECRLMRVVVDRLEAGTFFARLLMERDGEALELDARPSDALAMALRTKAPIAVARHVMDEAGRVIKQDEDDDSQTGEGTTEEDGSQTPPTKHERSPRDVLKRKLEKAIQDERYEDAARYRDEISRLDHTHTDN